MARSIRPKQKHRARKGYQQQMQLLRRRQRELDSLAKASAQAMADGDYTRGEILARTQEQKALKWNMAGVRNAHKSILDAMEGQLKQAEARQAAAQLSAGVLQGELEQARRQGQLLDQVKACIDQLSDAEVSAHYETMIEALTSQGCDKLQAFLDQLNQARRAE